MSLTRTNTELLLRLLTFDFGLPPYQFILISVFDIDIYTQQPTAKPVTALPPSIFASQLPATSHARTSQGAIIMPHRDGCTICLLLLVALFFPPIAVLCVNGCDLQFGLNVLLFLLT